MPADTAPPVPARPMPAAPAPTPPAPAPAPRRAPGQPAAASAPAPRDAVPEAVYLPAPARVAETPAPRPPEPPLEENLRTLQQLPDAIQREVPKVSFGGYIYSPNPADRLLLVDKMLRREGEEVAPGLVLERLLPKYAVMNYRGTRYRVGY
ncbi:MULTISPECIES: general secretion pathway protein GspB [unclassified Massilia]|uniref:general secretion pathway protein GspB n=1 Tax=unclassified Massilia TaxID=2609279 RepID=UPI001E5E3762|nr:MULTISPECIES: general secretion pathway protein GspB [unclassified Massilia]